MCRDMSPSTVASRERLRRLPMDLGMSRYDKRLDLSARPFSGHNRRCPVLSLPQTAAHATSRSNRDTDDLGSFTRSNISENDHEPDQPHGHLGGGWLAGV